MPAATDATPPKFVDAPCYAGFFIVLPDPVPIPNRSTWTSLTEEREPFLDGLELAPLEDTPSFKNEKGYNFVSMRFLQVTDRSKSPMDQDSSILMEATARILSATKTEPAGLPQNENRYRTVVEMITFVGSEDDWFAKESKPDPLSRCLEELFNFHRSYRLLTHLPCEALTYKRLHPLVIMTRRKITDSEPVPYGVMLLAMEPNRVGSVANDIGAVDFDSMAAAHYRIQAGDPSAAFLEKIVDANYAFTQLGKNAEAVVHAAIGCEILLDGCLGMCLWEIQTSEQRAAEVFSIDLTPRVKNNLPETLGGNWSLTNGSVAGWYEMVAGLRNRVVHAGYQPDDKEVNDCLNAADRLGAHILDCLYKKFHLYPATAWTFLGTPGFENRGGVTRRANEWQEKNEVISSIRQYSKWRTGVNEKVQKRRKTV